MINATFDLKSLSAPIQLIKRNYEKCYYHLLNKLLDQDSASLLEHKDMEESWTRRQCINTVCENHKREESKFITEDTSGRSYQIKKRYI